MRSSTFKDTPSWSTSRLFTLCVVVLLQIGMLLFLPLDSPGVDPFNPTAVGHRLADLERYRQQGLDAYGNRLPGNQEQRDAKIREREEKITAFRGRLFDPEGRRGRADDSLWDSAEEDTALGAYLARQRHYLQEDLDKAVDAADEAGKTDEQIKSDPDVIDAERALQRNDDAFTGYLGKKKKPFTSSPTASIPSGGSSPGAMNLPSDGTSNGGVVAENYVLGPKGTARTATGVPIATGQFFMATGYVHYGNETPEQRVKEDDDELYAGIYWSEGSFLPPGITTTHDSGQFAFTMQGHVITPNVTYEHKKDDDGDDGDDGHDDITYGLAVGYGFNHTYTFKPWGKLFRTPGFNFGNVEVDDNEAYTFEFDALTNPWWLGDSFTEETDHSLVWNTGIFLFGTFADFQENPQITNQFQNFAGQGLVGSEHNAGINGAPAPSLNPAHWPQTDAEPISRLRLERIQK